MGLLSMGRWVWLSEESSYRRAEVLTAASVVVVVFKLAYCEFVVGHVFRLSAKLLPFSRHR